jgi:hypothetical protein
MTKNRPIERNRYRLRMKGLLYSYPSGSDGRAYSCKRLIDGWPTPTNADGIRKEDSNKI